MKAKQYIKWREKQLSGKGDKYYPKELLEVLKKPLEIEYEPFKKNYIQKVNLK
jgi:hypothetical protein